MEKDQNQHHDNEALNEDIEPAKEQIREMQENNDILLRRIQNLNPYFQKMIEDPWQQLTRNNYQYKKYRNRIETVFCQQSNIPSVQKVTKNNSSNLIHFTIEQALSDQ